MDSEKLYGELEGDHWLVGAKGDNRFNFFEAGFEKHDEKPGTLCTRRNARLTADLVERIKRLRAGDLAVIVDCAAADEAAGSDGGAWAAARAGVNIHAPRDIIRRRMRVKNRFFLHIN